MCVALETQLDIYMFCGSFDVSNSAHVAFYYPVTAVTFVTAGWHRVVLSACTTFAQELSSGPKLIVV